MASSKFRLPLVPLLCFLLAFSCATPFDFTLYDYTLGSLDIGIAFPPVNGAETAQSASRMQEMGMKHARFGELWAYRETADGVFNWKPLTDRVQAFNSAGIGIMLSVETRELPAWLAPSYADWSALEAAAEGRAQFRAYIAALLAQCGSAIEKIQFGNEWNWEVGEYCGNDDAAYISLNNILYDEVLTYKSAHGGTGPAVVLSSMSIGGLYQLAHDQGRIAGIEMEGQPVYVAEIAAYAALPAGDKISPRVDAMLSGCSFDEADIHLYDDFAAWPHYLAAIEESLASAGKAATPVIVSEFGGPYPSALYGELGSPDGNLIARRIVAYVHALDAMEVGEVYFFKLVEETSGPAHPASFLIDRGGCTTNAFEVFKRIGAAN